MDLSQCYLHNLGEREAAKLAEIRAKVPDIFAKAQESYAEAAGQTMWGVRMQEESDASNIVLLKYLRAEELDVDKASARLSQTLVFRAECKIDELAKAEMPEHFLGHDFISGIDADGRPVMISRFGGMDIDKVFGDLEAFVRYRAKVMENAIALLRFEKGAAEDLCQVHDYSGVLTSMYKSDVKNGVTAISKVFSEHYPEFKGKTIFVNFPAVFSKPFQALSALLPERTRNKFIILGQEDHAAFFEHVSPDLVPAVLGGLYRESGPLKGRGSFAVLRPREAKEVEALQVPGPVKVLWELRVCTLEIAYDVVFVDVSSGEETTIDKNEAGIYLKADDGIKSGSWEAPASGKVVFRFRNEAAWFKRRVCACRAEMVAE